MPRDKKIAIFYQKILKKFPGVFFQILVIKTLDPHRPKYLIRIRIETNADPQH
jgi:hypothetical protein